MMNINEQLVNVYNTPNQIEVKGENNVKHMYGSIFTLKSYLQNLPKKTLNPKRIIIKTILQRRCKHVMQRMRNQTDS